jgi:hypothetical protein
MNATRFLVYLVLWAASPALAVDGVIEINQLVATQTGLDSGDAPGFPITISTPGSDRLTSNLQVSGVAGPAPDAIDITADDVTLDLNGFTLS